MSLSLRSAALLFGTATSLALLAPAPAWAGGLGVLASGGVHSAHAYYYELDDTQHLDNQTRPNGALGLEALLGDRDDRVQGLFRVYLLEDAPLAVPDIGTFREDQVVYPPADQQGWSPKGVVQIGLQWGLYGDPDGIELILDSSIGSGFATPDGLEFLMADVGPGITYKLTEGLQFTANASVTARYRKGLSTGGNVVAGLRYLFD